MSLNWNSIVSANVRQIVDAAKAAAVPSEVPVCILFDIDDARGGLASPGLQKLIADTKLSGAVPISGTEGNRLVCLPISAAKLLSTLEEYEDVAELRKRVRAGGSVEVWAICFEDEQRTCLDIHAQRPEFN